MSFTKEFITGTWEMIEAWDIGDDPTDPTKKTYPWGNNDGIKGYWVYDRAGHFSMIIYPYPALPIPPQGADWLHPTPPATVPYDLLMESFSTINPYAYFGKYTVDMTPDGVGTINQVVQADVMRAYTGTKQPRPFTLEIADGVDYINVGVAGQYLRKLRRLT